MQKRYWKHSSRVSGTSNGKAMILSKYATVLVKNQDLLTIKKQNDY